MPLSEYKKLGVKAEHVPIKKRRFLYQSPSPPLSPKCNSPRLPENDKKSESDLGQDLLMRCQDFALGQMANLNVDVNLKKIEDNVDGIGDFSGISLLAAAACSINLGKEDKLLWDLNKEMGADKCDVDYHAVDCKIKVTDAVSKSSCDGAITDTMENNKENGSSYVSDTCDANQFDLTGDSIMHQISFCAHDNVDSDIPQRDPASLGGVEVQQTFKLQVDYDSQYEDGELKESIEHTWEEYDIEDGELKESIEHTWEEYDIEDGEAERASYGSDDQEMVGFDSANHHVSMSEGAGHKKYQFNDTNSSSSGEDFSLKNVQKSNCYESNVFCRVEEKTDGGKLVLVNKFHGHADANDSHPSVDLNIREIRRNGLYQPFKRSSELASRAGGFRERRDLNQGRIDSEGKVFGSSDVNREFQSRANDLENRGMFLRKDRPLGSRFNEVDGSESRYGRDWSNNHKSFRAGHRPFEQNWRGNTNNADRPTKRVRSPGKLPAFQRERYMRNNGAGFDDRRSNYSHDLSSKDRSFSPIENHRKFHPDRPYGKYPDTSHNFITRERTLNVRSPHFPTRHHSSDLDRRFPAYDVSGSPQRVKKNNYSRAIHFKENADDQRHSYRYGHVRDNRRHDSDEVLKSFGHDNDFGGAARRNRDEWGSFSHRRDREFDAN